MSNSNRLILLAFIVLPCIPTACGVEDRTVEEGTGGSSNAGSAGSGSPGGSSQGGDGSGGGDSGSAGSGGSVAVLPTFGSISTVDRRSRKTGDIEISDDGFEFEPMRCTDDVCVSGGITP